MEAPNGENWIPCNGCRQHTDHDVLHRPKPQVRPDGDGQHRRFIKEQARLLQCRGCKTLTLELVTESSDSKSPHIDYWPPRQIRYTKPWHEKLPPELQELVAELDKAVNGDCLWLAATGVRTIIDQVLVGKLGDVGGFEAKLTKAVKDGLMTKEDSDILESAIKAGHAAVHRAHRLSPEGMRDALAILDHLLQKLFVLPGASERLNNSVPGRGDRGGGNGS